MQVLSRIDFGNEAGDDADPKELAQYFVKQSNFDAVADISKRIVLITAKKGVGKSALLKFLEHGYASDYPDAVVVFTRGSDLVRSQFKIPGSPATPNEFIRDWMIRLSAVANRNIAKTIGLPLNETDLSIIESAEIEGFKEKNYLLSLLTRFEGLVGKYMPRSDGIKHEIETLKRVQNKKLVFLIDDLDATFQNTPAELLELSTFFSAVRYMARDLRDVVFKVTLRTNVWAIIRKHDEALDKFEQYVSDITWDLEDFRQLLDERIFAQLNHLEADALLLKALHTQPKHELRNLVIARRMEWGTREVDAYQVLYTLSYGRPRWGIQLLKLAQKLALKQNADVINKDHIDNVWEEYGKRRISDLVSEHKHQCPNVLELLNAFRGSSRRLARDELFALIRDRVMTHLAAVIDGKTATSQLDIANFLYRIGFIVARLDFPDDTYEHLFFESYPDLLSSRTDEDFGAAWEIHPCYREALDVKKLGRRK